MGNIHVLPTDKPSRIYLIKSNNRLGITSNNPEFTENFGSGTQNQNIYITSDEEIKVGDWFLVVGGVGLAINTCHKSNGDTPKNDWIKKIILTTDQELINDGVQSIDVESLEWFVNNPSCDFVEVEREKAIGYAVDRQRTFYGKYTIIIPQEEPKQEFPQIGTKKWNDLASQYFGGKSKQETLEEVTEEAKQRAKNYMRLKDGYVEPKDVVLGDKTALIEDWFPKQERMYSEEEVIDLLNKHEDYVNSEDNIFEYLTAKEWFKQYKKK